MRRYRRVYYVSSEHCFKTFNSEKEAADFVSKQENPSDFKITWELYRVCIY